MIWMKDGRVSIYILEEKVEIDEFEMKSCINRRTTALKLRNSRLLMFYV